MKILSENAVLLDGKGEIYISRKVKFTPHAVSAQFLAHLLDRMERPRTIKMVRPHTTKKKSIKKTILSLKGNNGFKEGPKVLPRGAGGQPGRWPKSFSLFDFQFFLQRGGRCLPSGPYLKHLRGDT